MVSAMTFDEMRSMTNGGVRLSALQNCLFRFEENENKEFSEKLLNLSLSSVM